MLSITKLYPTPDKEEFDFEPTGVSSQLFDDETYHTFERQVWREMESRQLFVQIKKQRIFLEDADLVRVEEALALLK